MCKHLPPGNFSRIYRNVDFTGDIILFSRQHLKCVVECLCIIRSWSFSCSSHQFQKKIQDGWSCTVSLHHTSGLTHPFLQTGGGRGEEGLFNLKENQITGVVHINQNDKSVRGLGHGASISILGTCLQRCTFCHPLHHGTCFINHIVLHWHISALSHGV